LGFVYLRFAPLIICSGAPNRPSKGW